jgi:hypothetical protein
MSDGDAETDEEACSDKHAVSKTEGLEDDTENHDRAPDYDRGATTQKVGGIWDDRQSSERADGHYAVEKTEH